MSRSLSMKLAALGAAFVACLAYSVGGATSAGAAGPSINPHRIKVFPDSVTSAPTRTRRSSVPRPSDRRVTRSPRCYRAEPDPERLQRHPAARNGQGRHRPHDRDRRRLTAAPTIASDLQTFDAAHGSSGPVDSRRSRRAGFAAAFDPTTTTSSAGASRDDSRRRSGRTRSHPGAKIVLASRPSNNDTDILNGQQYVVDHNLGDVISQSFGEAENVHGPDPARRSSTRCSPRPRSRDHGLRLLRRQRRRAAHLRRQRRASSRQHAGLRPERDRRRRHHARRGHHTGAYQSETAWTEPIFGCNPPAVDDRRQLQRWWLQHRLRAAGLPVRLQKNACAGRPRRRLQRRRRRRRTDLSARRSTWPSACRRRPAFFIFGGTSAGTPQWAGLAAIADQMAHQRLGCDQPGAVLDRATRSSYATSMHDITTGNNDVAEIGGGLRHRAKAGTR